MQESLIDIQVWTLNFDWIDKKKLKTKNSHSCFKID